MTTEEKYPSRWIRTDEGGWESDERLDGTPDFIITRHKMQGGAVRYYLKMRTSAGGNWFETATDAKIFAENMKWANR